jgi:hypothetical protein
MMMHAFLVDLEDKPGALADVAEAIGAKGANITSVSGATCGDKGRIAIATDDEARTRTALTEMSCAFEEKEITTTTLKHQPGTLGMAARQLAKAGINVESVLLLGMQGQDIEVGFVTSDPVMAHNALAAVGSASR